MNGLRFGSVCVFRLCGCEAIHTIVTFLCIILPPYFPMIYSVPLLFNPSQVCLWPRRKSSENAHNADNAGHFYVILFLILSLLFVLLHGAPVDSQAICPGVDSVIEMSF